MSLSVVEGLRCMHNLLFLVDRDAVCGCSFHRQGRSWFEFDNALTFCAGHSSSLGWLAGTLQGLNCSFDVHSFMT